MSIKNWPENERPREKLLQRGAKNLSDAELLAIFLRVGSPGKSALDIARDLLCHFGSLNKILAAKQLEFCQFPGMGPAKFAQLQASLEMSKRYFEDEIQDRDTLNNPHATREFLKRALTKRKQEIFGCLFLNTQNEVIAFKELFTGTLDSASVYPREVIAEVIEQGAASVIFCHNHPSGSCQPSQADIRITAHLKEALGLIDVRVLDHMIVAGQQVVSMAEQGLI